MQSEKIWPGRRGKEEKKLAYKESGQEEGEKIKDMCREGNLARKKRKRRKKIDIQGVWPGRRRKDKRHVQRGKSGQEERENIKDMCRVRKSGQEEEEKKKKN